MTVRQKIMAIFIAISIFTVIVNLVYRRKLREEYSWLWLLTGALLIVLTLWYDLLVKVTYLIGSVVPVSTLFFFGIIFLMLLCLQFSVRLSEHAEHIKKLSQELTLLKAEIEEKHKE